MNALKKCVVAQSDDAFIAYRVVKNILNRTTLQSTHTIGMELEIFLRTRDNHLSTLEESQFFLRCLSEITKWKIFSVNRDSHCITRVSKELDGGRYHSVKYEHPPHMIEIALGYYSNLIDFRDGLLDVIFDLEKAANASGLKLDITSKCNPMKVDWPVINQIETRYQSLSDSRKTLFLKNNPNNVIDERIDFPTFTAATQYHIGGIKWWEQSPAFMNSLYKNEFLISSNAYRSKEEFTQRWNSYQYVFGHMQLLGFPEMEKWSFETWVNSLVPKLNGSNFAVSDQEFEKIILNQRDLQIVKPKWIGTLEFRSDPATSNIDLIVSQAALRFASYINTAKSEYQPIMEKIQFNELSKIWHSGEHISGFKTELEQLKEESWITLRQRGKNEEGLL